MGKLFSGVVFVWASSHSSAYADYICMTDNGYPKQIITCYGETSEGKAFTKTCIKPHDATEIDCPVTTDTDL
jgi:hypothetical protein